MGLNVTVLTSIEDLETWRTRWDELYAQADASPYLCFDWTISLLKHRGAGAGLRVAMVSDADNLVAIVPLRLKAKRLGPLKPNILRLIGDGWPPRNGAIVHPRATALPVIQTVLHHLRAAQNGWLYCSLDRLPADSPLLPRDTQNGTGHWQTTRTLVGRSIVIEIPDTWDAYRATLSGAHRKNISRRINGLEKKYDVKIARVGLDTPPNPELLEKTIADSLIVSRASWQGSATKGVAISDEGYSDWYIDACRRLAQRGMLDLSVLYVDARPISFIWGAARWPVTTIAKLAFDPEFSSQSPGLVHLAKHIQDSITRRATMIDFGHEFEDYKRQWGKRADELFDVCYYPPAFRSSVVRWWNLRRASNSAGLPVLSLSKGPASAGS